MEHEKSLLHNELLNEKIKSKGLEHEVDSLKNKLGMYPLVKILF